MYYQKVIMSHLSKSDYVLISHVLDYCVRKGASKIRKVDLSMEQEQKYQAVKNWVDHGGNKNRIAMRFNVSSRTVNRWIKGYQEKGKSFFLHGNTGKVPACRIGEDTRKAIVDVYLKEYEGCNFSYFTSLLGKYENIHVSEQFIRYVLEEAGIYSPKMWRSKRRRIRKEQEQQKKAEIKTQPAAEELKEAKQPSPDTPEPPQEAIENEKSRVAPEDAHSTRPRCKYFGELIQMDASPYNWFGDEITNLHVAIDDSRGALVGVYFDTQETLNGYYHVLKQILLKHGIPVAFLTDRRTVFEYVRSKSTELEKDTFTQFSYACSILGVAINTTSIPQAKGRVERLNETLQGRLPFLFRKEGITDIESANEYLADHLDELFNDELALPLDPSKNVFEKQLNGKEITEEDANLICSILSTRSMIGQCIRYEKKTWKLLDENGVQQNYKDHTKVTVIKTFDNQLYANVNDKRLLKLELVPVQAEKSKNLDYDYLKPEQKKIWIPPFNHPWRYSAFEKHAKSQKHRMKMELEKADSYLDQLQEQCVNSNLVNGHQIA